MRALSLISCSALLGLWAYYGCVVSQRDRALPVPVAQSTTEEIDAASLNATAVRLARQGRESDALAYLERAHEFRPQDPVIANNLARQRNRVARVGWLRVLIPGTLLAAVLALFLLMRRARDAARLRRLRMRGEPWLAIQPGDAKACLELSFSAPVGGLLRRHPLQVVWSSAAYNKHMKSRPPVRARGRRCRIELDRTRLDRLRRYPGLWKAFIYVDKTAVGKAAARVG